jgi:SAM-dependent methyltransferase
LKGTNDWLDAARSADADDLREHILSGYKSGKPFTPYVPTIALPSELESVLDFGCGLGRNFPYLRTIARRVVGYDLPPMIERCRQLASVSADELLDDWSQAADCRVDLVFASLVLQHIEPAVCRAYLRDFARIAPTVYLITRTDNDFGPRVLDMVGEAEVFEAGECVEVDHDSETHQLRVLATVPFSQARAVGSGRHYELLLRSATAR